MVVKVFRAAGAVVTGTGAAGFSVAVGAAALTVVCSVGALSASEKPPGEDSTQQHARERRGLLYNYGAGISAVTAAVLGVVSLVMLAVGMGVLGSALLV